MIYKLAKTSPLLSGQVRWDMCLSYENDRPTVSELHITPLNDTIIYNEGNSRDTYNYSHLENVKRLYKTIESNFFSTIGMYSSDHMLYNNGIVQDPFDHTYRCGCRRMNRYSRYNRQFSYLCPMWISEFIDYTKLKFRITIQNEHSSNINYVTEVVLGKDFIKYISDYMGDSANGEPVGDELVNFKLDPVSAYIAGVKVNSGQYQLTDVTQILTQLVDRERPIMEFDSMILHEFEQHKMIAQQLINFNLVFNLHDICPQYTAHSLDHQDFNVCVDVYYDDEIIPLKDIYTNYTQIPSYNTINAKYDSSNNVLDYLRDNKYIDFAYINKMQQSIFHWALLENPDVLYNFYDGFGPTYEDENGNIIRINGRYYNQANIQQREYSLFQNNLEWCKHIKVKTTDTPVDLEDMIHNPGNVTKINAHEGICWIGSNKYELNNVSPLNNLSVVNFILPQSYMYERFQGWDLIYDEDEDKKLFTRRFEIGDGVVIAFLSVDKSLLTLGNIHDKILNAGLSSPEWQIFVDLFENWIPPYKINFTKSILPSLIKLDGGYSEMVSYGKQNDSFNSYVYRYTGKLIPYFINITDKYLPQHSVEFYYKQWSDINTIQDYMNLIKKGYDPKFMSTDPNSLEYHISDDSFYALKEVEFRITKPDWYMNMDYHTISQELIEPWRGDITWLNDNRIWNLPTNFDCEYTYRGDYTGDFELFEDWLSDKVWNELYQEFKKFNTNMSTMLYDEGEYEMWCRKWIYSKYKMSMKSEYESLTNINNIVYKIKFELK